MLAVHRPWWWRRYDKQGGVDSFYVDHGTWAFAIRKWLGSAKFYLIRSLMNALGYTSLAKKVWAGWQVRPASASCPASRVSLWIGHRDRGDGTARCQGEASLPMRQLYSVCGG